MFKVTQSNDTKVLLQHLVSHYQQANKQVADDGGSSKLGLGAMAFAPFTVIVPSMVLGDWLTRSVADELGISTLFVAQFWGQYQWQMIQKVLQADAKANPQDMLMVPEVAVLSRSVMRWRIFGFISGLSAQTLGAIIADDQHPLNELVGAIYDENHQKIPEHRLWQSCDELAAVYVRYLTHRPEWLHAWTEGRPLPESVEGMIAKKDRFANDYADGEPTPEWLVLRYQRLERLLRYLWHELFGPVYAHREALEARFWAVLDGARTDELAKQALALLPNTLYLFTVQQIPLIELQFLKRLSVHIDVHLLHFNPSKMFWADIVDKNWLATQRIINPKSVYLKDHGHALLSRLAKESRETFAMLADMSGGEFYYEKVPDGQTDRHQLKHDTPKDWQVLWQDAFVVSDRDDADQRLLDQLKADILMLDDGSSTEQWWQQTLIDALKTDEYWQNKIQPKSQMNLPLATEHALPSLSIHACSSLRRQLQVARLIIARYLNEPNADGSARKLSDVVVYLPDVGEAESLIRLVFDDGVGIDGLQLPAKITGTTSRDIEMLMQAISGFYRLLGAEGARFYREEVYEWLMTPVLYDSLGLDFASMSRACELLDAAGFRRGFDTAHLAKTLNEADLDYRYSFSYALDRIVAGFLTPDASLPSTLLYPFSWQTDAFAEAVLPLAGVTLADGRIIEALCVIHQALSESRDHYQQVAPVEYWLWHIEHRIIDRYFDKYRETSQMRAIFEAKNSIQASIRANKFYQRQAGQPDHAGSEISLSLKFVLESISGMLSSQAISAEATGVITFARFGALRSIPFGLTLMLDMNLSAFPRQERQARMDLMKAGLKRRGDRYAEDDDNGAFLDAILCTRDACAIFYTDTAEDGTLLLPASPVSELIEFFKSNVQWSISAGENVDDAVEQWQSKIVQIAPQLVETLLITRHAPTPFDASLFYRQNRDLSDQDISASLNHKIDQAKHLHAHHLPPPPIMHQVRQILDTRCDQPAMINLPQAIDYEAIAAALQANMTADAKPLQDLLAHHHIQMPTMIALDQLHRLLINPAKGYLQRKIALQQSNKEIDPEEPLMLDGLGRFQLKDLLIDALATGAFDGQSLNQVMQPSTILRQLKMSQAAPLLSVYYDSVLPAGVNRLSSFDEQILNIEQLMLQYHASMQDVDHAWAKLDDKQYSAMITDTADQTILINTPAMQTALIAKVPSAQADRWLRVLPSAARINHLMRYYLSHLAWQIHRQTTEDEVIKGHGSSFWQFDKPTNDLAYFGLDTKECLLRLRPITAAAAEVQLVNFIAFALMLQKQPLVLPAMLGLMMAHQSDEMSWDPKYFSAWLNGDYEEHYGSSAWQLLLKDCDVMAELTKTAPLAQVLYGQLPQIFMQSVQIKPAP